MAKKADLQKEVEKLGIDPKGMSVEDMEKVLADNDPNKKEVTDAKEVKAEKAPPKKSMFNKPKSFVQLLEECSQKCADFINTGGDEKEMRKYLKSIAES